MEDGAPKLQCSQFNTPDILGLYRMRKSGMYHSQMKAMQAHGPASSYCLPATSLVLGTSWDEWLMGISLLVHKVGVITLLSLVFCGRSQDIPVVQ